jgi:predicted O-linked N-acetylglucosamine transferase (SPINDLY family)
VAPGSRESSLLLACTKPAATAEDEAVIRQLLADGIDWTVFARTAADRGLVGHTAHTLARAAPDMVPADILEALHKVLEQVRSRNREVLEKAARDVAAADGGSRTADLRNASEAAERALAVNPNDAGAWRDLGLALLEHRRHKGAVACYGRALELGPDEIVSRLGRARALAAIGQADAALADIDGALALDQQHPGAWSLRARTLFAARRFAEASEASARAVALAPENTAAARTGIQSRLFICDWRMREADKREIAEGMREGRTLISLLHHRAISDSEAQHLILTRLRASTVRCPKAPLWRGERYRHDKIRIAYLSTDLRDHVVADAIVGCFEQHDRTQFETTAISLGPDDGSATRRRIEAAFDRFIDVRAKSDAEVSALVRDLEIDVAIDLNGYSGDARPEILAPRPAPVQVNYFGYPGTMAVPFINYIIADPWLIPADHQPYYTEQVVYLPYTYLPSDRKRPVASHAPTRAEAGLPDTGFVFACLHNSFKIGPELFDLWCRLLRDVKASVLWFLDDGPSVRSNLQREALQRGVAPERLVFAPRIPLADHLARLRLADLFLDALPYCAHTSASDALWAGLPVLTCPGNTFAGRVAAALLHAVGLPELVAGSISEYEQAARSHARDPTGLAALRSKLAHDRDAAPIFDTGRFTRDLETAYRTMWERQQAGLPPAGFSVPPAPPS